MNEESLDNKLEPIYNSSMPTQDITWKTSWKQWTIETQVAKKSQLAAWHDDEYQRCIKLLDNKTTVKTQQVKLSFSQKSSLNHNSFVFRRFVTW